MGCHVDSSSWNGNRLVSIASAVLFLACGMLAGCGKGREQPPSTTVKPTEVGKAETTPSTDTTKAVAGDRASGVAGLSDADRSRAKQLYTQHCAACHGEKGDGQAIAARFLFPKPRDFTQGRFRLVSTTNGVPTISDIVAVLARGMPGSVMPPWPKLSESDRKLLAEHVIEFRREGIRAQQRAFAAEFGEDVDEDEVKALVADLTTPGPPVDVPEIGEPTPEAVNRGRELYLASGCAACHGKEGRGDGQQTMVDSEGLPTRPRDLTKGIFKGSPDPKSVYIRTQAGMPGSPMPMARQLTPEEVTDMVHFVLSLSDEKTRQETVLSRQQITVRAVPKAPETPDDEVWNEVSPVRLRTTPLWWRDNFEPWLDVQAVHDGKSISVRLSWNDPQADTHAAASEAFEDAAAIEFYRGESEPFLGMGAAKSAVDAWMWDADRQSGGLDVADVNPNVVVDIYPLAEAAVESAEFSREATATAKQADATLPARASGNPIVPGPNASPATALEAAGPGTVSFRPAINQTVQAQGEWIDGRWSVVFTRPLAAEEGAGLALEPGEAISVAFAVWDGAQRDRDGQKLITIWQDLVLEDRE